MATVRPYLVANRESVTDGQTRPSKSEYKRICDSTSMRYRTVATVRYTPFGTSTVP